MGVLILMNDSIKYKLKDLEIFSSLKNDELDILTSKSRVINLKKGEILFYERDSVNNVYIVLEGKVTLYRTSENGQKRVIFIIDKGKFINEIILDKKPASICCEGFENSKVLSIKRNDLLYIMDGNFQFTQQVMFSMTNKIRRMYRQLKNTVPLKVEKRVAAKLWKLAKDYGECEKNGEVIKLNITVTYLSEMLGSSRETISRALKELKNKELIYYEGKKIIIKDRNKLSEFFKGM